MTATVFNPQGFYLDGRTPVQHPVRIEMADAAVRFQGETIKPIRWEFAAIDWDATRLLHGMLRLKHLDPDDAWLVITDAALIAAVMAEKKIWARHNFPTAHRELLTIGRATAAMLLVCATLWISWPYLTKPLTGIIPDKVRTTLSDVAQHAFGLNQECRAPEGLAALQQLTDRLTADYPELRATPVIVVDAALVNALTLPNDKILLTRALLDAAESSDEIGGIIAHELGHVAHRHVLRSMLGKMTLSLLVTIFTGPHGDALAYANDLSALGHSRQFETEADTMAIALLRRARIAPQGLGRFFGKMQYIEAQRGDEPSRYFATHPPSEERAQHMMATEIPDASPALPSEAWQALRNICGTPHNSEAAPQEQEDNTPATPDTDTDTDARDI